MSEGEGSSGSTVPVLAAAGGCLGFMAILGTSVAGVVVTTIFGGLGVLFSPIIAIILFFGGGGDDGSDEVPEIDTDEVAASVQGDGKGKLDTATVPDDLAETIEEAGGICDAIGPVVIAAQIERESSFNKDMKSPDGKIGISQLPPDKFEEFGEDEDDNDETSATDAEDSIMAQGRYLCSLAESVKPLVDSGQVPEGQGVLDLTLAAYHSGLDAVRGAKGIPKDNGAQNYVIGIRSLFPRFEGIGGSVAPSEFPSYPSGSATPEPDQSGG
ncbi:transglycosylase SLT domain-containing protein [Streptomyces sp. CA-250714]|uniref:lytic transglycosylase domain-containing protein n=1 Tax=Streptomyces sp. CA-250714 TaxID=3240060 RepID=UPI003D8BD7AA